MPKTPRSAKEPCVDRQRPGRDDPLGYAGAALLALRTEDYVLGTTSIQAREPLLLSYL